jgi:hypothetical protein
MLNDPESGAAEGLRSRWAVLADRFTHSVWGYLWLRARELNLATLCLALAAQQMLCTAPLLVAFSVIARRTTGSGVGSALARYLGLSDQASVAGR